MGVIEAPVQLKTLVLERALDVLACPSDKSGLRVETKDKSRINSGKLVCDACGKEYPIRRGIIYFSLAGEGLGQGAPSLKQVIAAMRRLDAPALLGAVNSYAQSALAKLGNPREAIAELAAFVGQVSAKYVRTPQQSAALQQAFTGARYNLEDYRGTFRLPRKIASVIPSRGGVAVEGAPGLGACLLDLQNRGEYDFFLGVDISGKMAAGAQAAAKGADNALFVQGDVCSLPIKEEAASLYVVNNAWDRIPNPRAAALEGKRIIRDGGSAVFSNCIPLQFEYERDGSMVVYVPRDARLELEDAVRLAGCAVKEIFENCPWPIETLLDGKEELSVKVVVGGGKT